MRRLFFGLILSFAVLLPQVGSAQPAGSNETYYMMVFGYQNWLNAGKDSHTFATFVKATTPPGATVQTSTLDAKTISWLPAQMPICPFCAAEPGRNYRLDETLAIARAKNLKIEMFGPYRIEKSLYDAAMGQIAFLASGNVKYKAVDKNFRIQPFYRLPGGALNCIHAVSDLGGYIETGTQHGIKASATVTNHLAPWVLEPTKNFSWVAQRLGLVP